VSSQNADTIAAIATGQGRGAIGVVKVSGSLAGVIALSLLGKLPVARYAGYYNFLDSNGDILDKGVALYFTSPNSYTGEDVLELQGHGGKAVLQLLIQRCLDLGARLAQPGEFTLRAFLNNKLDLAQAESVSDLIDANTAEAARCAVRSLSGEFSSAIHRLVDELVQLRILVEACLDFPEEELDHSDTRPVSVLLLKILQHLEVVLNISKQGSLLREGAHIAIAGQTNVGKSSLLNSIACDDVALVSNIPGTTRDVIRQVIQIRGVLLNVSDTAGLRESEDFVERMGIERAHQTFSRADLILFLVDASKGLTILDQAILSDLPSDIPRIIVYNKIDLVEYDFAATVSDKSVLVSAKTKSGIDVLLTRILEAVGWRDQECGIYMARERHLRCLALAQKHLNFALSEIQHTELLAEELRLAQVILNEITGEFSSDDLLGEIFGKFCIGK
jgi:tRNA modification GTPase